MSQHLKVLRDSGFASMRIDGARRIYAVDASPIKDIDAWLERFRRFWEPKLDALATEVARGKLKTAVAGSAVDLIVSLAERGRRARIISARAATKRERNDYEKGAAAR